MPTRRNGPSRRGSRAVSSEALTSRANRAVISSSSALSPDLSPVESGSTQSASAKPTGWRSSVNRTRETLSVHKPNIGMLLWILAGLAVSIPVLFALRNRSQDAERQAYRSDCQSTVAAIQNQMMLPLTLIYGYRWFFDSGVNVTQNVFQRFTKSYETQSWMVPWVGYAPYVTQNQRASWEATNGRPISQGPRDGESLPVSPTEGYVPVNRAVADTYFPTQYVPEGSEWLIGFDVLSDSTSQPAVFRALNTGLLTIGQKVQLRFENGYRDVHRFVLPWFGPNGTGRSLQGIFYGVFDPYQLIDTTVQSTTANISLGLQVLDASGGNAVLYAQPRNSTPSGQSMGYYSFPVADRTWILYCWGKPKQLPAPYVAFVFLLLTFLLLALLTRCCMLKRRQRDKSDPTIIENPRMSQRQIDWMRTNAYSILGAIRDPLLLINREGYVIDANDEGLALTKLVVEDLIFGIHISRVFPGVSTTKSRNGVKDKHFLKISHPPGPWASSTNIPAAVTGNDAVQEKDNVVIDVDSTYINLPDSTPRDEYNAATDDDMVIPGMQETVLKTKDGREITVEANFSPIVDCQDQKERIQMVLFRDMSGWKSIIKETLEAKDAAEMATTEKSNFLAFVCHELRNPLHVVIGLNSILMQSISSAADNGAMSPSSSDTPSPPPSTTELSDGNGGSKSNQAMTLSPEGLEHLASVADAARVMKFILNDMRLLSKIEAGTVEIERVPFDLKALTERMYKAQMACKLTNGLDDRGVCEAVRCSPDVDFKLVIKGLEDVPPVAEEADKTVELGSKEAPSNTSGKEWFPARVRGDATKLQQALLHLVSNSFESTKRGSVILRVIVEGIRPIPVDAIPQSPKPSEKRVSFREGLVDATSQVLVRFEVEDTGEGFPTTDLPNLLKKYSPESGADRAIGTSGLSLNITNSLLQLLGGEIQMASTPGKGTKVSFSLWFDLLDEISQQEDQETNAELKGLGIASSFGSGLPFGKENEGLVCRRESIAKNPGCKSTGIEQQITPIPDSVVISHDYARDSPGFADITSTDIQNRAPSPDSTPGGSPSQSTPPQASPSLSGVPSISPITRTSSMSRAQAVGRDPSIMHVASPRITLSSPNLTPGVRRSSQGDRKSPSIRPNGTKKSPNPAVRRLGTHPLKDRPIRVLVVEDNEVLLKIAATTLTRAGFEVQQAQNGEQAVQRIEKNGEKYFDVCLMDLLMPVMDGFQATEEIRRRGWTIPVIALTAKTLESDRLRCFKIGFNYFMTKPFQLGDIATVIRFMVGAEAEQQAQGPHDGATPHPNYGGPWSKFT
ncbi:uncharacterized protein SPPG_01597 [Spizellomyces punctatus DAOM BR117]|uniref:Uncharacterized protein n=1 Tax=Spizellomyces punctatus (strain DAOM BR117) TaxID=645134 RepID=A0A0L0HST6_SPIPD|nr:uncharacterized protein SPPG_01597 [Spizellomyces punctatus DAOM BR117]KND04163.1 hypothetical protein SPPG_01597 [Spizellomyces punctatus DAOM BR117]|eukprot:XP_016612202.1 hypothetical protein SPPG_01597 [Spizellomyces punctatus DAOM BR117]